MREEYMSANLLRKYSNSIPKGLFKALINRYSPFKGAKIKIVFISENFDEIKVEMPLKWNNRNYVGTHFGGSLYSMTDPFYMLILMQRLGDDYIVWDKSASIEFLRPGRTKVHAHFMINDEELLEIKNEVDKIGRLLFKKSVDVTGAAGEVVARIQKTISIKKKKKNV